MGDKLKRNLATRERPLLLRLENLELHALLLKAIEEGVSVKAVYDELPLEQILVLDMLTDERPSLRFMLRKERGRYSLTILSRQNDSQHK
jgi:hypothetical protein